MSLTINGSGGGIPADVNQIVYTTYTGAGIGSANAVTIDCPLGKPTAFIFVGYDQYQSLSSGYRINIGAGDSFVIRGERLTTTNTTFLITGAGSTTGTQTLYMKFVDNQLIFYNSSSTGFVVSGSVYNVLLVY